MRSWIRRAALGGRRVRVALAVSLLAGLSGVAATVPAAKAATSTTGYYLVGTDGGIFSYGGAKFFGSTGAIKLNQPIVGMAATPDGRGYWMVASDGGIFAFGTAAFYGSMGGKPLNQPIVGMASTRTGKGYWMVASDGGIFSFGDAAFFGSTGAIKLNKPIVDLVPTPSGRGYWMAASDGGIFSFGDAAFFGSTGAIKLTKRIQQMATTPTGRGYWLVAGDGGVFSFGDAAYYGSAAADGGAEKRIVDIAGTASGKGYYLTASNGAVYAYGDAKHMGGAENLKLTHGVIAMVALNSSDPPVAADDLLNVDEDGVGALDVLVNDHDPGGLPLSIDSVTQSARGGAVGFNGGTVTYKPAPDFNGNDSFSYTVTNSQGATATAQVAVKVKSIDDLPRTVDDAVTVPLGQSITIDVLANDTGLGDLLSALNVTVAPQRGTAAVSPDLRSIVYTPDRRGQDSFRYRVVDTDGDNNESLVKVFVTGPNSTPSAVDVNVSCPPGCEADVLKAGATLGDNGAITLIGEDAGGNVTVANVGTFTRKGSKITFAPAAGFNGMAETRYQIFDDGGTTDKADDQTVDAAVRFAYGVPTAQTTTGDPVVANTPRADYQLSASDPEGEALTFYIHPEGVTGPVPNPLDYFNFNKSGGAFDFLGGPAGTWVVTFHVMDGHNISSNVATFTFTVN